MTEFSYCAVFNVFFGSLTNTARPLPELLYIYATDIQHAYVNLWQNEIMGWLWEARKSLKKFLATVLCLLVQYAPKSIWIKSLIYLFIWPYSLPSIHPSTRLTFTNLLLAFFLIRIGLPPLASIIGLLCCFLWLSFNT